MQTPKVEKEKGGYRQKDTYREPSSCSSIRNDGGSVHATSARIHDKNCITSNYNHDHAKWKSRSGQFSSVGDNSRDCYESNSAHGHWDVENLGSSNIAIK